MCGLELEQLLSFQCFRARKAHKSRSPGWARLIKDVCVCFEDDKSGGQWKSEKWAPGGQTFVSLSCVLWN